VAKDKTLSIKVPIGLYERMIREVELGEYTNVSDLTKVAIRMHLLQLQQTRVKQEENNNHK
jgi:Arc/MetJ-type ribon-helix-helix transcriptional regulator